MLLITKNKILKGKNVTERVQYIRRYNLCKINYFNKKLLSLGYAIRVAS